ncbi:BQ2448_6674 [Microbotryum intermedium]|uniref:BQ2448_6674 protein n=1 Tax=Microbotryum intermedium TaxID=269621 RepID=A0A238FKC3_9BASI|nr:BQ2448_6674 [Microbotryum intermedium]
MLVFHMLGALAWAGTAAAQTLQIASPALYTCQPAAFAYTCDNGPCTVFIRPSDDPTTTLQTFAGRNTGVGSITYTPGATAGSSITAFIYNSAGNFASNAATQVFSGLTGCGGGEKRHSS